MLNGYGLILQKILPAGSFDSNYCLSHLYLEYVNVDPGDGVNISYSISQTGDYVNNSLVNVIRVPITTCGPTKDNNGNAGLVITALVPSTGTTPSLSGSNTSFIVGQNGSYIIAISAAASPVSSQGTENWTHDILWDRKILTSSQILQAQNQLSILWKYIFN